MSLLYNQTVSYLAKFAINVVKCGQVPRHMAFIMNGSRRYNKIKRLFGDSSHRPGAAKMFDIINWCGLIGVKEVSVYAFSILNFGREKYQVDMFMNQLRIHLQALHEDIANINLLGIRIKILGNLELLERDLRKMIGNNTGLTLNILLSYTFTHELGDCVKTVVEGVQADQTEVDDINKMLLYDSLYANFEYPPDIVVRTSGPKRLSDFLMWQLRNAKIHFIDEMWSSVTIWRVLQLVFDYQLSLSSTKMLGTTVEEKDTKNCFLQEIQRKRTSIYNLYKNL